MITSSPQPTADGEDQMISRVDEYDDSHKKSQIIDSNFATIYKTPTT